MKLGGFSSFVVLDPNGEIVGKYISLEAKLSALEVVNRASMNKIGRFTKQDIREPCPSLSVSSIEGALRKLVTSGGMSAVRDYFTTQRQLDFVVNLFVFSSAACYTIWAYMNVNSII